MRKLIITSVLLGFIVAFALTTRAQIITTVAGCGIGDDSTATKAELFGPVGVAIDSAGNTYIGDASYRIRKVSTSGVITTIAGSGIFGNSGDGGPATSARIGIIYSIAADRKGNIYIVDNSNNCIRKIDNSGIITTVAGTGVAGYSGDSGLATAAMLNTPIDIVVDTLGNIIFTDWQNYRVRKINTSGIITTIVGDGSLGTTGIGGPATAAELGSPFRITMDNKGNLYVAEVNYQCVCKVDTKGILTIVAGTGAYATGTDGDGGPATSATMTSPCGLAVDTSGNLYFSDIGNGRIRKVDMNTGIISNYAANGIAGYSGDGGIATAAQISTPEGLACDKAGNVYICDADNNRIRKVSTSGTITTFAGQNALFGESYKATDAELSTPHNLATDTAGNVYISDVDNNRVRKLNAVTGIITTVAGSGIAGYNDSFSGDGGPATSANIYNPEGIAVDNAGNIYIADVENQRIRKVNNSGIISTIAGTGTAGHGIDGIAATLSELNYPTGVAVDNAGNVYIADQLNFRIRKINTSGIISTVAGKDSTGYSGDGFAAVSAYLSYPNDVATDGIGNIYISDAGNYCIRKIDTAGIITTIAGNGIFGYYGDGSLATAAELGDPSSVKADRWGNIYIADGINQRVRMVDKAGIINTIAGNGKVGFSGDGGTAVSAMLNYPADVAADQSGNIYIADGGNYRVRKLKLPLAVPVIHKGALSDVAVYPNPTTGLINVINAAGCEAVIYDAPGKEIMKRQISTSGEIIDLHNLANGIYLLQVSSKTGEEKMIKIIKE